MKRAYCSGCKAVVELDQNDACPQHHPRSCYRDVVDTAAPTTTERPAAVSANSVQLPRRGFQKLDARLRGAILLALGVWMAKVQIWDPLHASQLHMRSVLLVGAGVFAGVVLPPLGVAYLVFGDRVDLYLQEHRMDRNNLKPREVAILLLQAAPVCILWVVILQRLMTQGYQ